MAAPFTIDESLPGDNDIVSQHPANARTFRNDVEDYLNTDHDATTGHHAAIGLVEQSTPSNVANTGFIYSADDGGDTELFYLDDAGNEIQITADGAINALTSIAAGAVDTTQLAANAVTGAKIAMGSDAQGDILFYGGTDYERLAAGTSGQFLQTKGNSSDPVWADVGITDGTKQATTSGSAKNFTSIPAGVSMIIVDFDGVSLSGSESLLVQIGDSGGLEASGYVSNSADPTSGLASTAGFVVKLGNAGRTRTGHMTLTHIGSNRWVSSHVLGSDDTGLGPAIGGGGKTLSATLDRLTVLDTGSDNFDAGQVNIHYI